MDKRPHQQRFDDGLKTRKEVLGAEKGAEAEKDARVSLAMLQQAEGCGSSAVARRNFVA